jgi:hypothetical protein
MIAGYNLTESAMDDNVIEFPNAPGSAGKMDKDNDPRFSEVVNRIQFAVKGAFWLVCIRAWAAEASTTDGFNEGLTAVYAVALAAETAAMNVTGYKDFAEFDAAHMDVHEKYLDHE